MPTASQQSRAGKPFCPRSVQLAQRPRGVGVDEEAQRGVDDLAAFQRVIDQLLTSHHPYPGFVVDRHWNMVEANRGAERFLAGYAERNTVRLALGALRPLIENWQEVAVALLARLSDDVMRFPDDALLQALHGEVRTALGAAPGQVDRSPGRVICPRFRIDGALIRTITVVARFESVADVTLDEVRVELIYRLRSGLMTSRTGWGDSRWRRFCGSSRP